MLYTVWYTVFTQQEASKGVIVKYVARALTRATADGQTTTQYSVYEVGDDRVRIRVKLDRAYRHQSSAVAEIWSRTFQQWNNAAILPWQDLDDGPPRAAVQRAESELLEEALLLLK